MLFTKPFATNRHRTLDLSDIVQQGGKKTPPMEIDNCFRIVFDVIPLGAEDEGPFPERREFPSSGQRELLVVFWKRDSARPNGRRLPDEVQDIRSIGFEIESELCRGSIPSQSPKLLSRWPPTRLNWFAGRIRSYPSREVVELLPL